MLRKKHVDNNNTLIVNESGSVVFKCPNCGENEIARTRRSRLLVKEYTCEKCNFIGP